MSNSDLSEVDEESANSITPVQGHSAPLSISVDNSSDIKIGSHLQYNAPVTIKQYFIVNSVENLDDASNADPIQGFCRNTGHYGFPPDKMDFKEPDVLSQEDTTTTAQEQEDKNQTLGNPFSWKWMITHTNRFRLISATLVLSLFIIVIIAVLIIYTGPDNYSSQLELIGSDTLIVSSGDNVQWEVQSNVSYSLVFEWTDPKGKKLTRTPNTKYRLWDNGHRTVVTLYDVTHNHSGIYVLRAYNLTAKFEELIKVNLTIYDARMPAHGKVVACYVASWAFKRKGDGAFGVEDIHPILCTHLIYAFATMDNNSNTIQSWLHDYDLEENGGKGSYKKMTALRKTFPRLKVMLSVGGWAEGAPKYSKMANSSIARKAFVVSISNFLRKHEFDGLDLHWLYPVISWRNDGVSQYQDCANLVVLLKELRKEFDKFGLILTMPLGMATDILKDSYDIPGISKHVHYLFAMCYAYHGHWEPTTGPNAPLYPLYPGDQMNVEQGIHFLLSKGVPPEKLVLGIPLYGRLFLLTSSSRHDIGFGVPSRAGVSLPDEYVEEPGYWGYNDICRTLEHQQPSTWTIVEDEVTHTPYAYNLQQYQFLSYDDAKSIEDKVDFAIKSDLAGVMTWSLDTDDFHGVCSDIGSTKFPLMKAINKTIWKAIREKEEHLLQNNTFTENIKHIL